MENSFGWNRNPEKSKVVILFVENVNFKPKMFKGVEEGHYICVSEKLQEEELQIYMHQVQEHPTI